MTGPEHYREAEKLLGYAEARDAEQRGDAEDMSLLAEAQVHATLALAAGTALANADRSASAEYVRYDGAEWRRAAGVAIPLQGDDD
ncbi:hypothetical protein [Streptomyces sp. NPDC056105]|uniref:hypothetical protein n=1 Tax=Streptomyces sp. NPDC056105 TaxID=3345714 RepID=UPI0035D8FCCA